MTRYFLSRNERKDKHDVAIGRRKVPALAPGESSKGSAHADIAPDQQLRAYFVIACADAGRKVRESSEKDNCRPSHQLDLVSATEGAVEAVGPPVAFNGITTPATVYTSNVADPVTQVEVYPAGDPSSPTDLPATQDPQRPNTVDVDIPSGLPPGSYDVVAKTGGPDSSPGGGVLTVAGSTTLTVSGVDTPFAADSKRTGLTIAGSGGFQGGTLAYLTPHSGGPAAATDLHAAFEDPSKLAATVPPGTADGTYDLVVLNPTGQAGVLQNAITVVGAVPEISGVSPTTVPVAGGTVDVAGSNFSGNPAVGLTCRDVAGGPATAPSSTIGTHSSSLIEVTFGTSSSTEVCALRVTNEDGSYADFGPVGLVDAAGPSGSAVALTASNPPLNQPRASLGLVAGPQSQGGSYLYAIGGDQGASGTSPVSAANGVESAPIDEFGSLGSWRYEANPLPTGIELAGAARIGGFIYLAGGWDGTNFLDTVYRAQILKQADAPEISSVAPTFGPGDQAPDAGTYTYRVAAVFGGSDSSNPGGESLPSSQQTLYVPQGGGATLQWDAVPGASAYRIYRAGADAVDAPDLLAEVGNVTTFHDDGGAPVGGSPPLRPGSLGTWSQVATLGTHRRGPGVAESPDPSNSSVHYLYALGGESNASTALSSVERVPVTIGAGGSQTVGADTSVTGTLGAASWNLFAQSVGPSQVSGATADTIYAGGGENGAGTVQNVLSSGVVSAGGDISAFSTYGGAGFTVYSRAAATVNSDNFWVFGGMAASVGLTATSPSATVKKAPFNSNGTLGTPWGSAASSLTTARGEEAAAQYGPVVYLAGGSDATNALASVERELN